MNFDKLKIFTTLYETRHFSKTAEALYISQPNVTKQIRSLEQELGYPLIERQYKNFSITAFGELFYRSAVKLLQDYEQTLADLEALAQASQTVLHIGATPFIGSTILPAVLTQFKQLYPEFQLSLKIDRSKAILEELNKGNLNIAFLSEYIPINEKLYSFSNIYEDPLVFICAPNHPLASKPIIHLADLAQETYISKGSHSSLHRFLYRQLNEPAFMNNNAFVVDNQFSIKEAVAHGLGIAIVSELLVKKDLERQSLAKLSLSECQPSRNIRIVYAQQLNEDIIAKFRHASRQSFL